MVTGSAELNLYLSFSSWRWSRGDWKTCWTVGLMICYVWIWIRAFVTPKVETKVQDIIEELTERDVFFIHNEIEKGFNFNTSLSYESMGYIFSILQWLFQTNALKRVLLERYGNLITVLWELNFKLATTGRNILQLK